MIKQLSAPCRWVVPISLFTKAESQLYHWLKRYKADWATEHTRAVSRTKLAGLFAYFMSKHDRCIESASG
ncbi:MAG: hypothetical protein ACRD0M_01005, partial [Acidimicrobiales bacterium]